jgi:hypothetical protein
MLAYFILVILFVILLLIIIKHFTKNNIQLILEEAGYLNYEKIDSNILNECQVPTLNSEQCYKSRFYECPIVNGSYLQCTNNYIPKPDVYNADCANRTFDMVPYPWKISENCYYNKIGFNSEQIYGYL